MKISIITQFYDNDYTNIPNFISNLNDITFDKEVIFVDDRNNKSVDIRKIYNISKEYKIIWSNETGKNVGTFEARRTGAENATGDYIWFVDIDDELVNIDDIANTYKDEIICYSYNLKSKEYPITKMNIFQLVEYKRIQIKCPDTVKYLITTTTRGLWNKLFKTDLVKQTLKTIPFSDHFINHEDGYLFFEILNNKNVFIEFRGQAIYTYTNSVKQDMLLKQDSANENIFALISSRIPECCPDRIEYINYVCSNFNK